MRLITKEGVRIIDRSRVDGRERRQIRFDRTDDRVASREDCIEPRKVLLVE